MPKPPKWLASKQKKIRDEISKAKKTQTKVRTVKANKPYGKKAGASTPNIERLKDVVGSTIYYQARDQFSTDVLNRAATKIETWTEKAKERKAKAESRILDKAKRLGFTAKRTSDEKRKFIEREKQQYKRSGTMGSYPVKRSDGSYTGKYVVVYKGKKTRVSSEKARDSLVKKIGNDDKTRQLAAFFDISNVEAKRLVSDSKAQAIKDLAQFKAGKSRNAAGKKWNQLTKREQSRYTKKSWRNLAVVTLFKLANVEGYDLK